MNIPTQIMLALGSVVVLLFGMAIVRKLAKSIGLSSEVQRKLIHIATGLYAMMLPWLFPDGWPVYMLIAITLVVMLILRLPGLSKGGLGSTLHSVERRSYGDFLLAISIGVCFFLADGNVLFYVLPIAILTLADAAAALAGTAYGTKLFQVEESQKSIEGSVVFFGVTFIISYILLFFLGDLLAVNILILSLMIAAFGTLVEAQSWRGFDNLFLPLGLLIFLDVHSDSSLTQLALLAATFFVSIVTLRLMAPRIGLTAHAARVYVTAIFLLLAVVDIQNAVLPVLVLVANAWRRAATPCNDNFPDLDIAAALALFSFGWLTLGNAIDMNALSFYGLSAMGLTMGLSVIALKSSPLLFRIIGILCIAAGLYFIRQIVVAFNPIPINWAEPLNHLALLILVLMTAFTAIFPKIFQNDSVQKLTLLSVTVPLCYYLYLTDTFGFMR